jgi:hypothetical protein
MLIATDERDFGVTYVCLDGSKPALRPCRYCGSVSGVLTGPKGPHYDGVQCEECHRHLGWLPPPKSDDPPLFED